MIQIIADTNILINLYGAFLHKGQNVKPLKSFSQILKSIENKKLEIFASQEILKEFSFSQGKSDIAISNFKAFLTQYIHPLHFSDLQQNQIGKVVYSLGHDKITYTNEYNVVMKDQILFPEAQKAGDRNFIDLTILAQAVIAGFSVVTINKKDFEGYKYMKPLLEKQGIKFVPKVFSVQDFTRAQKTEEQIF